MGESNLRTGATVPGIATLLLAAATLGGGAPAFAQDSADINVSADIAETCEFDAPTYVMDFGNLNPLTAVDVVATADLVVECSVGLAYTLNDVSGARTLSGYGTAAGDSMSYEVDPYSLTGTGTGTPQTLTLTGTVLSTEYIWWALRTPGPYDDTMVVNITP